jgi:hypothetical protein
MFLSKHHYAIELAKRGNTVYFLNPPQQQGLSLGKGSVTICESGVQPNLYFIDQQLFFPYNLKFHWISLFHLLMKIHVRKLIAKIEHQIDIVWSFDLGNLYPFSFFPKTIFKIFHPVDEPLNQAALNSAAGTNVIFSVTNEILERYKFVNVPKHFVNHGVLDSFIGSPKKYVANHPIRIGFSGNLLRKDIDTAILLKIIKENPYCLFEFWGSYKQGQSNIGGDEDQSSKEFVSALGSFNNVRLHGVIPAEKLANEIQSIDVFLICYDVLKDQSKGTNYHKVMEYLATGKLIISNNITTYADQPELIRMVDERDSNKLLPELFKRSIENLENLNRIELVSKRINFASENTYFKQVTHIENLIAEK